MLRDNVRRFDAYDSGAFHNSRLGHNSRAHRHNLGLLGLGGFFLLGLCRLGLRRRFFRRLIARSLGGYRFGDGSFNNRLGDRFGLYRLGDLGLDNFDLGDRGFLGDGLRPFFDGSFGLIGLDLGCDLDNFSLDLPASRFRFGLGFFDNRLGDRFGLLAAFAPLLLGLFVRSVKIHVFSGLHGASAVSGLTEPLNDSRSQTGFDRGHVVLDLYALGTAFLQYDLTGNAERLG